MMALPTGGPALRAVLAAHGYRPRSLTLLGAGLDHAAYLVDGHVVVRVSTAADASEQVRREAELLNRVATISPVPVPLPLWTAPEAGCLAYRILPGRPLLHTPHASAHASSVGARLGQVLAVLHRQPIDDWSDVVAVEHTAPKEWLPEAQENYATVTHRVPVPHRRPIEAFLEAVPPRPDPVPVLCHNDLGIEHVLVDAGVVTGILDWTDAAITDPARDFALIYRDLGRPALEAALSRALDGADPGLVERARFYARCALLEDLAHGLRTGQHAYTDKSLTGLTQLFPQER